ncbi:TetR/AcrR family transcriptional regulator [Sulfidibacter corallicola]|uniref:TetR/AcrR family transcriptional regulator n=1 Tax=Sulfidibacter corallicola TaxID=2818388 RepID=A0A8A4TYS2_SULCO|nr:TetR family transcriptional regulator [Sulfidibacter corallicola]QTD54244.1 TetR/AcrR family transcriptional regulator [Sulfidibacter corallicola]
MEREPTVMLAMENYWREGVQALSINEVCRRTNLSKPSLYREFGGEDGLLDAALECYGKVVIAPMIAGLDSERSFAETLESMIDTLTAPRDAPQGCLLVKMRGSPESLGTLAKARVDAMVHSLQEAYEALFLRARSLGEARNDVTPRLAARYLDTQVTTVLRQLGSGEEPDQVKAEARLSFAALLPGAASIS